MRTFSLSAALVLALIAVSTPAEAGCYPSCVSVSGEARGTYAVSMFGNADGDLVAVGGHDARGGLVAVGGHNAKGGVLAVGTHDSSGMVAVSCGGRAQGRVLAVECPI